MMLRFKLHQVHIADDRFFVPLPKLTTVQLGLLRDHLGARGFRVRRGTGLKKMTFWKGARSVTVDGRLGLASSRDDLLDLVGPAIPDMIAASVPSSGRDKSRVAGLYCSTKRGKSLVEFQFFPRLESLRTWTHLRRGGLCALTPDEAAVLRSILGSVAGSSRTSCVTASPREGSTRVQAGKNLYYESQLPIAEFLSSLRTIDSGSADNCSYLPRNSILSLRSVPSLTSLDSSMLGEWCSVD